MYAQPGPTPPARIESQPVRVLVVDDHLAVAQAIAAALAATGDIEVIGCAAKPWEARTMIAAAVDVALVDVALGGHDGVQLAQELIGLRPGLRLILMSDEPDARMLESVITMGARGYVNKSQSLQQIIEAVRQAHQDHIAVPVSLFADLTARAHARTERTRAADTFRAQLTERELEVLSLVADGMGTEELASHLTLSVHTVRSHVQNTLTKLGVRSRLQAVARAREAGVLGDKAAGAAGRRGARIEHHRRH